MADAKPAPCWWIEYHQRPQTSEPGPNGQIRRRLGAAETVADAQWAAEQVMVDAVTATLYEDDIVRGTWWRRGGWDPR